jgi:hypothetical protein
VTRTFTARATYSIDGTMLPSVKPDLDSGARIRWRVAGLMALLLAVGMAIVVRRQVSKNQG